MRCVRTDRRGAVLEVVLDRPPANAIDAATSRALGEAFIMLRDDPELRVAIIVGAGEQFFSAGWDLKAAATGPRDTDYGAGGFAGLTELFDLDKPVIAAVNGLAVGGGFELTLACDLVVAASHAEFFLPEVNLGLVADGGGVLRLPKRLPRVIAMEMLLTGRRMGSEEALARGLVNAVVPAPEVLPCALAFAETICAGAPLAVSACKEIARATEALSVAEGYRVMRGDTCRAYHRLRASDDFKEGPRAFAERRKPLWKGR